MQLGRSMVAWHGQRDAAQASLSARTPARGAPLSFLLHEGEVTPSLRSRWAELVSGSTHFRAIYQSPEWWQCSRSAEPGVMELMTVNRGETVAGVVSLRKTRFPLQFEAAGRQLLTVAVPIVEVLGGTLPVPEGLQAHGEFLHSLLTAHLDCDGVLFRNVRADCGLWPTLRDRRRRPCGLLVYAPEGVGPFYSITLPDTFSQYLGRFKADTRKKLQRKVRRMRDLGGGRLALERVERPDQVDHFLSAAGTVVEQTWQRRELGIGLDATPQRRAFLAACADTGLLRSYLLRCGDTYSAFGLGYQYRDSYHLVQIGFDGRLSHHSPGTVQFFLMLEDLSAYRPAHRVDFGHGEWGFKKLFATELVDQASYLLLRPNVHNHALVAGHRLFRSTMRGIKGAKAGAQRLMRRARSAIPTGSEAKGPDGRGAM